MMKTPGIVTLAPLLLLTWSCGMSADRNLGSAAGTEPVPPQHVILLTIDTWRDDHFLANQGGVFLTPELANLAERSIRFSANHSVGAVTSAGVASLLTGLLPKRSGVIANDHVLSPELPTLATMLKEAGFTTAGFVANPVIAPGFGFENGFDHYERIEQQHPHWKAKAPSLRERSMAWLDQQGPVDRLFLWLHFMEPHGPYEPNDVDVGKFAVEDFDGPLDVPLSDDIENTGWQGIPLYQRYGQGATSQDSRVYLLRYAAEVHGLDQELGTTLQELDGRGYLADSMIIVGADHGEALAGDHGYYFSHDNGMTQDQIQVPLMISCPGCPTGETVSDPTSNIDVLPTVLARLDLRPPENLDGVDLLSETPPLVFAESTREIAIRQGNWKLRWRKRDGSHTLIDLASDPGEATNLSQAHPERVEELTRAMRRVRARPRLIEPQSRGQQTPEEIKELEALGYVNR